MVLNWIGPIDRAVNKAVAIANPYGKNYPIPKIGSHEKKWPDLLNDLATKDLEPSHRFLLPPGIYDGAQPIIEAIDLISFYDERIKEEFDLAKNAQEGHYRNPLEDNTLTAPNEFDPEFQERIGKLVKLQLDKLTEIMELARQYEKRLQDEYTATYQ